MGATQEKAARRLLEGVIENAERIIATAVGQMRGHVTGLVVLTDRKIIMAGRTMLGSRGVESFPLERVGSVSVQNGVVLAKLRVTDGSTGYWFENMQKHEAKEFLEACQSALSSVHSKEKTSGKLGGDFLDQLERLAVLHQAGHLSDEEFSAAKKKLIASNT